MSVHIYLLFWDWKLVIHVSVAGHAEKETCLFQNWNYFFLRFTQVLQKSSYDCPSHTSLFSFLIYNSISELKFSTVKINCNSNYSGNSVHGTHLNQGKCPQNRGVPWLEAGLGLLMINQIHVFTYFLNLFLFVF